MKMFGGFHKDSETTFSGIYDARVRFRGVHDTMPSL
jgi:hypothetical protein